ncbi:MAG: glycosyl hydrolase-related protein [Christensenellaceae bacterium]|jgi:alpha-mannosidase|nr:glycosyl hydrolase-related protein [Christensenellaceae bacterium]
MDQNVKYFSRLGVMHTLRKIKKLIYSKIGTLSVLVSSSNEPVPFSATADLAYTPVKPHQLWSHATYGSAWFHLTGSIPSSAKDKHVAFLISLGGEGCLVDPNGSPIQGFNGTHGFIDFSLQPAPGRQYLEFKQKAIGGEKIDYWVEAGNNFFICEDHQSKARFKHADIVTVRDDIKNFYYDVAMLTMQISITNKSHPNYAKLVAIYKKALYLSKPYTKESIESARRAISIRIKELDPSPYNVYATGHAHLDLAWLWPIRETKRKAARTFVNALRNIERYDGYVFGASQPQQFEWMEQLYPSLFTEIKNAVSNDRIELQGGMWVECDTNIPSGESIIRQNLYGKKYWQEKFGRDVNICWLPDVFGFSGNLPQFIKKCGMNYFLTIKLSWNEHNKFPKRTFIWEGIDNSSILVHMPPEENYVSDATPMCLDKAVNNYPEKDKTNTFGMLYGVGDGGGGPGERHLEFVKRENSFNGLPKVIMSPAIRVFEELEASRDKYDVFKGELYLEKHQGTYTTQSNNKLYNRKLENKLHNIEFLYAISDITYPKAQIESLWKEILLYQFHDIIPGSSIGRVYSECATRYNKIDEELTKIKKILIEHISTPNDAHLSAINPTSFAFNDIVKYDEKYYIANLPPYGAAVIEEYISENKVRLEKNIIENDRFAVKFSNSTGEIISLYDKKYKDELVLHGKSLNRLSIYDDKRLTYNAWDIDINYSTKAPKSFKLIDFKTSITSAQVIRENIYEFGSSVLTQQVILTAGKPIIEFSTVVDWQETHKMFRVDFWPAVYSDEVTCDIQMGNIKRSTKNETSIEKAQFEICAHKWVDVSSQEKGFSVFAEAKYGWRIKEGLLSLNVLRSTMWPAKDADKGVHNIRYAIYPHSGNVFEADIAKYAYQYNFPPIFVHGVVDIPAFITSSSKHVVIETIKPAESGKGIIVRAYEDAGVATRVCLSLSRQTGKPEVYETDMLENIISAVNIAQLVFNPYEIKTLLVL